MIYIGFWSIPSAHLPMAMDIQPPLSGIAAHKLLQLWQQVAAVLPASVSDKQLWNTRDSKIFQAWILNSVYFARMIFGLIHVGTGVALIRTRRGLRRIPHWSCIYISRLYIHTIHYITLHSITLHFISFDFMSCHFISFHYVTYIII